MWCFQISIFTDVWVRFADGMLFWRRDFLRPLLLFLSLTCSTCCASAWYSSLTLELLLDILFVKVFLSLQSFFYWWNFSSDFVFLDMQVLYWSVLMQWNLSSGTHFVMLVSMFCYAVHTSIVLEFYCLSISNTVHCSHILLHFGRHVHTFINLDAFFYFFSCFLWVFFSFFVLSFFLSFFFFCLQLTFSQQFSLWLTFNHSDFYGI